VLEEEQLKQFISLIDERDQERKAYNEYIIDFLSETVRVAVHNLLNIPHSHVEWQDIQIVGPAAVFDCLITYSPAHELSEFLQLIDPPQEGDSPVQLQRELTLGIPLSILFKPHEVITKFLLDIAKGMDPIQACEQAEGSQPIQQKEKPSPSVAPELTEEQIQQMLFFQQTTKGKIQ